MHEESANYLLSKTAYRPQVGIICGSGLSQLSNSLTDTVVFHYEDIPGFPKPTVQGHSGELVFGKIGQVTCVCMKGRFHFYEGHSMDTVVLPIRVMRLLGVQLLIVTNAAGGLNPDYRIGDIMIIQDHFGTPCVAGNHPLRGINDDSLGPRFPSLSDAYDEVLQDIALHHSRQLGIIDRVKPNGTYCYVSGPTYESRAECRFLRSIGGDSVGMSTVPEVIAAKHCGMKILGMSFITNEAVMPDHDKNAPAATHAEVLAAVEQSGKNLENLVKTFVGSDELRDYLSRLPVFEYKPKPRKPVAAAAAAAAAPASSHDQLASTGTPTRTAPPAKRNNNETFLVGLVVVLTFALIYTRSRK